MGKVKGKGEGKVDPVLLAEYDAMKASWGVHV
jgi:hypothetical protein